MYCITPSEQSNEIVQYIPANTMREIRQMNREIRRNIRFVNRQKRREHGSNFHLYDIVICFSVIFALPVMGYVVVEGFNAKIIRNEEKSKYKETYNFSDVQDGNSHNVCYTIEKSLPFENESSANLDKTYDTAGWNSVVYNEISKGQSK